MEMIRIMRKKSSPFSANLTNFFEYCYVIIRVVSQRLQFCQSEGGCLSKSEKPISV